MTNKGFAYRARKRKPPPPPPAADSFSEEEESFDEQDEETLGRKRKTEENLPKPGKRVRLQPSGGLQYKKRKQTPPSTPPSSRKSASSLHGPKPPASPPKSKKTPIPSKPSRAKNSNAINVSDMLREYASVQLKSKKAGPLVNSFLRKFIEEFEDEFEAFQREDQRLQKRKREFEENERKILIHQQKENIKRLKDETQRIRAKIQVWDDLQRSQKDDLARWGGSNSGIESFEDYRQILSQPDFRYVEVNKLVPSSAKPSPIDPLGLSADRKTDAEKALESFHTKVLRLGTFHACLQNFCATAGNVCNEESKALRQGSFAPYNRSNSAPGEKLLGFSSLLQAVANAK